MEPVRLHDWRASRSPPSRVRRCGEMSPLSCRRAGLPGAMVYLFRHPGPDPGSIHARLRLNATVAPNGY
ncbi:hypothetical protein EBBID32_44090 [Sphingobium indicum BiD32]|uniref:Uncharacterized protein n=1 Tax=Sphingobium indicum BiD32 TaxID=1301087 RepID=N1MXN7_9SPHN|nr:hypothetical protein EBBID32_44090 [Sphingobium indicum BiD32]